MNTTSNASVTKNPVLGAALDIAMTEGNGHVSFEQFARQSSMSKSGEYSRAGSLQDLQEAVPEPYGRSITLYQPAAVSHQ